MNIPNILTSFRILLIGVFVYLFCSDYYMWALAVYVVAVITDWLDGFIARKYNMITNIGKLLDPLADKCLLITALLCAYIKGILPWYILVAVAAKEVIMVITGIILYKKNVVVYAKLLGKLATGVFNVGVVLMFFHETTHPWYLWVIYAAMALSLGAFIQYGVQNVLQNKKAKLPVDADSNS
ncbi:MAG: CDP-alcohol phosphatidyltransferase family protein [Christensenellales bacterium]